MPRLQTESQPVSAPAYYCVVNVESGSTVASRVSLAGTSSARRKGLCGRKFLVPGEGLWIAPCEAIHTFGMHTALDVLFLDKHHRVRKISSGVKPWRIAFCFSAASALEIEPGAAARSNTRLGDRLEFHLAAPL